MAQQKMCGIFFAVSMSPLILPLRFGDVLMEPFATEYEPSSWGERVCNMFFPLWFQRGYNMSLNPCTIDRSGALQDWETWLLEEIPIQKKISGSEK